MRRTHARSSFVYQIAASGGIARGCVLAALYMILTCLFNSPMAQHWWCSFKDVRKAIRVRRVRANFLAHVDLGPARDLVAIRMTRARARSKARYGLTLTLAGAAVSGSSRS